MVEDVYCVPSLATLLSVSQLISKGNKVTFSDSSCSIYNKNNELVATALSENGEYKVNLLNQEHLAASVVSEFSFYLSTRWLAIPHTREELLGSHLDPLVLNKISFALPSVDLARAFHPECTSLSEKSYKDMKIKMLGPIQASAFCVGLIIGPPSIGSRIGGSAIQNELIASTV
ncbi:hypothetical protein HF086_013062 [Spodoptera exigua]|uniref:Uncharacterized protein n=1 Tax=Spodoptera exigua TaxID=7107 RepID=A0A922M0Z5_SPOEX|nr:hypothetical protein HF086_013062 [Spodoptera exigua]